MTSAANVIELDVPDTLDEDLVEDHAIPSVTAQFLNRVRNLDRPSRLDAEAERTLITEAAAGSAQARNALTEQFLPLVVGIASRYKAANPLAKDCELEDLVQEGAMALLHAAANYDAERFNVRFSTYLHPVVTDRLRRYLAGQAAVAQSLVSGPSAELLMDAAEDTAPGQFETVETKERSALIAEALKGLSCKEQSIIKLRFGFATGEEMSLREVAQRVGLSYEAVRAREAKALKKLQPRLQALAAT